MKNNMSDLIQDVVASPLGDVIASVGEGVAEAQQALDEGSLAKTLEIYSEGGEDVLKVLRDVGYRPTFYALPETTGEVRVSLRLGKASQGSAVSASRASNPSLAVNVQLARVGLNTAVKSRLYATPVDAGYANRYGYQANVSAKLSFKIVPVPAPDGIDELRVLPDFVGKTVTESQNLAEGLGLEVVFHNTDDELLATPNESAGVTKQIPPYELRKLARVGDEIILTVVES